jgi:hypothetical protein
MNDDALDIDALHVIVDNLQTCASMIKDAWLEDREDQMGYLADRLMEHVAELRRVSRYPEPRSQTPATRTGAV